MFMGDWLNHCGYFPSWNQRLLRRGAGSYERPAVDGDTGSGDNEVHEHVILRNGESKATVGWCKHTLLHYAYPDISTWIEKHNRYSNWEAAVATAPKSASDTEVPMQLRGSLLGTPLQVKRWIKERAMRLPMRPTLRFFYHYVWKSGWRDGYRGFVFCRLLGWYEFLNWAKSIERRELSKAPATR
jgi:hypothetical protein